MKIPKLPGDTNDKKEVDMDRLDEPAPENQQPPEKDKGLAPGTGNIAEDGLSGNDLNGEPEDIVL